MARWEYKNEFVPMLEKTAMYLRQFNEDRKKLQKEENLKAFGQQFGEAIKGVNDITQLSKAMTDWTQKAYAMDIPEAVQTVNQFAQMKKVELDESKRLRDLDEQSRSLLELAGDMNVIHEGKLTPLKNIDVSRISKEQLPKYLENMIKFGKPKVEDVPYYNTETGLGAFNRSYTDELGRRVDAGRFEQTPGTNYYDDSNTEAVEREQEPKEVAKLRYEASRRLEDYAFQMQKQDRTDARAYARLDAAEKRPYMLAYNKARAGVLKVTPTGIGGQRVRTVVKLDPTVSFDDFWSGGSRYLTVDAETGMRMDNLVSMGIGATELEKQTERDYKALIDAYFIDNVDEATRFRDMFNKGYYNASPHYITSILNNEKKFKDWLANNKTGKRLQTVARETRDKAIKQATKEGRTSPFNTTGKPEFGIIEGQGLINPNEEQNEQGKKNLSELGKK